ncbi:MAG: hypothetical protein R3E01_25165 [Pirellulaceae bacterium]|nr:hypothetical protein [Planctomycetales bacterium]
MSTERQARMVDAGWTITCERHIQIDMTTDHKSDKRTCTWRAVKGVNEVVIRGKLGEEQAALIELYAAAKSIDPDLRQLATDAGSGAWVFDLSQVDKSR